MNTEAIDYEGIDPGIRDTVRKCREHGFETTDSGDGVSKQDMDCALPFPHVFMVCDPDKMLSEAVRLQGLFPVWRVEASYAPADGIAVLMLMLHN